MYLLRLPHHPLAVCRLSGQFLKVNAHTGHRPGGRAQPCSLPCQRRLSGFWSTLSLTLARARSHARIRALQAPRCSSRPRCPLRLSTLPSSCADLSPMPASCVPLSRARRWYSSRPTTTRRLGCSLPSQQRGSATLPSALLTQSRGSQLRRVPRCAVWGGWLGLIERQSALAVCPERVDPISSQTITLTTALGYVCPCE